MVSRCFTVAFIFFFFLDSQAQLSLEAHRIVLKKGTVLDLKIPKGYHISVAADVTNCLRFLAKSPDNQLFGTDMYNRGDNKRGKIYLFEDWDDEKKQFRKNTVFAENLHNPNQIMFYTDKGIHYLYIAETGRLTRYEYRAGDKTLRGTGQVLAKFPDYGLDYKYGGWHLTRSVTQHNGKIYVSVGSSCNACIEKEEIRASIVEMNPDGTGQKTYATGVRNAVGIKWFNNQLWATFMGRDLIGPDKPEDLFGTVTYGKNYGWPYYVQYQQKIYPDPAMMDSAKKNHIKTPPPPPVAYCGFKAHSAPLGFEKMVGFNDPLLKDKFLVALHGSTTVSRERGNSVVMIAGKNKYVDVVTGFLKGKDESSRVGRPCDVLMNDANSFFITDDKNGILYYVWK
jgi:glucose/arabinose dehydrogenase